MNRKQEIGERIKVMRMSRNMSQLDLADALHCGQSTVAMWEIGKRLPDLDAVDYLADIFNVPPYAILYSEREIMDIMGDYTQEERRVVRAYRNAIPEIRGSIIQFLELNAMPKKERHA